ncbi:hypothetical protein K0M31_004279 [Melipona bicolor]|uniref:Uncharacterized protein n=1 Tax=Melipona bicolor TaxID=60889 RepID=A0AA40FWG4_9HYME|nr:hypothetical protein K0M31_004279 [Melipona bicolor]
MDNNIEEEEQEKGKNMTKISEKETGEWERRRSENKEGMGHGLRNRKKYRKETIKTKYFLNPSLSTI